MGGNLFKHSTRRLFAKEYFSLSTEVKRMLQEAFPTHYIEIIPAYTYKPDFGDCDILINSSELPQNWIEIIKEKFQLTETNKNGNILSFPYREMQIDLITAPDDEFNFSLKYFSFNDLGNLIGRIAHKQGFKFGHDGLWYIHRDGTHVIFELCITKDWDYALRILGFDPGRYHQGFDTLKDIFHYVIKSQFFNVDIFLLHNRNAKARVRDSKRKTYMLFLEYCELHKDTLPKCCFRDKSYYLENLMEKDAVFHRRYVELIRKAILTKHAKLKFNGDRVSELTGLKDQQLGEFMAFFKKSFADKQELEIYLVQNSQEIISKKVMELFAIFAN